LFSEKSRKKNIYYFLSLYLLLWIILFEFVFPVNNVLPKPSIVMLSFGDLWHVYNFGINFLSTFTIILISIVLAYFLIWLFRVPLTKGDFIYSFITSLEWFSNYIPGIILGLLLIFWFPDFEYTDIIFAFTAALFSLIIKFKKEIRFVKNEYIEAVQSLGATDNFIAKSVVWKSIEPALFNHLYKLNFYLWTVLIVFEYIKGKHGLGSVIRLTIQYQDLAAFFSTVFIIGLTIFILILLGKFIQRKYYYWESA